MPRRGLACLSPLAVALALGLGACGGGAGAGAGAGSGTVETPDDTSLSIDVTREEDRFTPNGARVEAAVGEPVVLRIVSDEPGEIHVHSVPEQEIAYDAGTSEHEITIDRPGVVEVESHDPDLVVLQLEVR